MTQNEKNIFFEELTDKEKQKRFCNEYLTAIHQDDSCRSRADVGWILRYTYIVRHHTLYKTYKKVPGYIGFCGRAGDYDR